MDAHDMLIGHGVQHDESGVGHAWHAVEGDDVPASIEEEIAAWIIEDDPDAGDEYTGTNGQTYRLPPE